MLWGLVGISAAWAASRYAKDAVRWWLQEGLLRFGRRLMADPYDENLWELISASRRPGPQVILETNLRSQEGTVIQRPLGSPREWPDFRNLVFDFAQLARRPLEFDAPVDTTVVIGPRAAKPMRLETPIIVSAMAYGSALSAGAKVALARGAALAGTASNSGEGLVLPLERQAARHLIVQYHRGTWGKDPETLRKADMIEIHFGQGASGGLGSSVKSARRHPQLRADMGLLPGQDAVIYSTHPELREGKSLGELVQWLRELTGGVPIGVKLAPGRRLEEDLALCIEAGVDVIALDGAQAGTKGSPPILQDDFGVPTLHALLRATEFLETSGVRDRVTLIVGGGLFTPGDFLKALALGADAVYVGSIALFAVTHDQVFKSLPWEPPTQVVFFRGHQAVDFDIDEGADRLARFIRSCTQEMAMGARALGKRALRDIDRSDLMALDAETAAICGVVPTFRAPEKADTIPPRLRLDGKSNAGRE